MGQWRQDKDITQGAEGVRAGFFLPASPFRGSDGSEGQAMGLWGPSTSKAIFLNCKYDCDSTSKDSPFALHKADITGHGVRWRGLVQRGIQEV